MAPGASSQPRDGLGNPAIPHILEFGQTGWNLRRVEIQGDQEAAQSALLDACKTAVASASAPKSPAPQAELRMLADLRSRKPLAAEGTLWGIYRIEGPFPILVGVRPRLSMPRDEGPAVAVSGCRVVTWGLAVPVDQDRWTVYTFGPDGGDESASAGGIEIPLPPGCTRQFAVRAEAVSALRSALEQLEEIDREVLVLRHLEELSNNEVAQILGIDKYAASKRYLRALERLRGVLPADTPTS